ncbi:MAG: DNA polymerase III subunit epsilon [Rhodocyclaceae bacterium]|nr:MAG: DNA polymerase III subunit epsilon [Rhodocyclaceae bacterium]
MNARLRYVLALVVLGLLITGPFLLTVAVLTAQMPEVERQTLAGLLLPRLPIGIVMSGLGFAIGVVLLRGLFNQYVEGLLKMAELMRLMLGANRNFRVTPEGPPEVQMLGRTINELAQQRDDLLSDVEAQIRRANTSLEEEKNRLAALMSELTQSVIVCNLDGRILLYNNRAREEFRILGPEGGAAGEAALLGLGRSIFSVFDRNLVTHALEGLQSRVATQAGLPSTHFVTATGAGQLIRVQVAPVLSAIAGGSDAGGGGEDSVRSIGGYVLMLDNITRTVESETTRDELLQKLTEGSRAALANIRAAVETLLEYPDIEAEPRERFLRIIGDEVLIMGQRLAQTLDSHTDAMKARWPLEEMLGADLIAAAQRRIESKFGLSVKTDTLDDDLWVKVDSFSLIQAISYLAGRLKETFDIRLLRFRLARSGRLAHLDMAWMGAAISTETLHGWELEPMNLSGENSPLTLHDIMDRHGGELWFKRESATQMAYFRLLIPVAERQEAMDPAKLLRGESRPEYYDFDLFKHGDQDHALDDRLLTDLAYTVFDTETTGLRPSEGDEIIQFGAVRVVNGRILRGESFEQLVDPRRRVSTASVAIHGLSQEMVDGQPTMDRVLPLFHRFCEDTVLVAHNAAFDMRFLELKEERTGIRFGQPVLDTLLLSAVVHPNQDSHKLELIAERLGIAIIGRHTALGDAIVTGEVFLRLIPLLNDMGIHTLGEALAAAQKTYFARVRY